MRDSKNRSAGIRSDSGGVGLVRHFPISDLSTLVLRSVIHRLHVSVSLSIKTHREGRHRISSVYVVRDARLPCSRFLSDREEVESLSTTTANRPIKATDCSSLLDYSELHLQDCARCILGAEQQLGRTAEEHSLRYKAVRVSERVGTLVSPCHGRADGGLRYYLRILGRLAQHAATSASRAICTHTGTACNPKSQKTVARKEEDVESVRLSMLISRVEPSQPPPCRFGQTHGYLFPLTTNDKLTSSHCSP
jgi:hypothetical protein